MPFYPERYCSRAGREQNPSRYHLTQMSEDSHYNGVVVVVACTDYGCVAIQRRCFYLCVCVCLGRTKLEPIAIVVLSVIMSLASIQMIRQSAERIVAYAQYDIESATKRNGSMVLCVPIDEMVDYVPSGTDSRPVFGIDSIVICVSTIGQFISRCYLWHLFLLV